MSNTIIKAPCVNLSSLETLFIEMTAQNCNLKCKNCYINFNEKKLKDFIPIEKVKQALINTDRENLKYIYFTGAEPMLHPDFNHILRLCLKYSSVIINTNAVNINDKKARFLRKVEEENNLDNEIIFMISIDHYNEKENDLIRGRGSYRKAIHAIQSLIKYDFNPILTIVNYQNIDEIELKNKFKELCLSFNFETTDINFKIIPYIDKNKMCELSESTDYENLNVDCTKSRTLTLNGIFSCPLLSSDNRGKCGNDLTDYSKRNYLETSYCAQCCKYNRKLFLLDL